VVTKNKTHEIDIHYFKTRITQNKLQTTSTLAMLQVRYIWQAHKSHPPEANLPYPPPCPTLLYQHYKIKHTTYDGVKRKLRTTRGNAKMQANETCLSVSCFSIWQQFQLEVINLALVAGLDGILPAGRQVSVLRQYLFVVGNFNVTTSD